MGPNMSRDEIEAAYSAAGEATGNHYAAKYSGLQNLYDWEKYAAKYANVGDAYAAKYAKVGDAYAAKYADLDSLLMWAP